MKIHREVYVGYCVLCRNILYECMCIWHYAVCIISDNFILLKEHKLQKHINHLFIPFMYHGIIAPRQVDELVMVYSICVRNLK